MPDLLIYGASDDLVEMEGYVSEEFDVPGNARFMLTGPDGDSLEVQVEFGRREWDIGIHAFGDNYPSWPIQFRERPDYPGDPAVLITVPEGTTVDQVG